jgi:hypothetical protein
MQDEANAQFWNSALRKSSGVGVDLECNRVLHPGRATRCRSKMKIGKCDVQGFRCTTQQELSSGNGRV